MHTDVRDFRRLPYWWCNTLKLVRFWCIALMNSDRMTSRQQQSYSCRLPIKESITNYEKCAKDTERLLPNSTLSWGWVYSPSGFQPHWSLRTFSCIIPCVSVCESVFLQAEMQVHLTNCSNVMAPTREPAALAPTGSRQMKKVTDQSLWRLQIFLSLREEKGAKFAIFYST